jgi:spore coat protein A, manganese oxidase
LATTRREFLAQGGIITVALAMRRSQGQSLGTAAQTLRKPLAASSLAQFGDPLPVPNTIQPNGHRPNPDNSATQLPYYRVAMREFEARVHRDLKPTRMWGYESMSPGPMFETRSGQGLFVEWVNDLPSKHFLPIDHTLHGAAGVPEVRAVVHLHGAKTPPASDGYPEKWYVPGKSAVYHYPNQQDATMLWYHDHALGINRLNVFAGLFGAFLIRDEFEDGLNLPRGRHEIPLLICDRMFDVDGQLNYPVSGNEKSPWVPEVVGDALLVNGKLFPYLEVEPRKYRFRVLNGSNGRAIHLTLVSNQSAWFPKFYQIGSDQGLFPAPVQLMRARLLPAERADLIFDFSDSAGNSVILRNDNFNVLEFRVAAKGPRDESELPYALRPVPRLEEKSAAKTRMLTLMEIDDAAQRPVRTLLNNTSWSMPVTEDPVLDSVEVWNLVNLTNDDHPIHLHLVRFQILDRRGFDVAAYKSTGELKYVTPALPPDLVEAGWKDTVRADHGMVTRIIIRFEGFAGRYVWHCHNLEHEDNEMMRPFDVVPSATARTKS